MKEKKAQATHYPQQASNAENAGRGGIPWSALEQQVARAQRQIAQASQRGDRQAVHRLQQQLLEAEAARLLAVRRVTAENQGKHTAGVDGVKSLTAQERLAMSAAIHPHFWNQQPPMPVRRVWIAKPGRAERRPLAILPMIDRCKQALVKLALEPEWEVKFEAHSYGFRPGRSTHDAIAVIVAAIERHPAFVFDADIEGAFDHVQQAAVLEKLHTFPALRHVIHSWLTAGVIDGNAYVSSETGIAQGGVLSPLLMNIALHGMETVVTEGSDNGRSRERPLLVRYADDFVIVHADLNELQQAVRRVKQWLARMGLHLHADKTRFTHTLAPYQGHVGFDFLGFNIRQETVENIARGQRGQRRGAQETRKGSPYHDTAWAAQRGYLVSPKAAVAGRVQEVKTLINPSREASTRHLVAIEHKLQQLHPAPQAQVIAALNPLILGWANYYNGVVPAAIMSQYDELLEQRLINWASQRHPGKARDWLLSRYWQHTGGGRRVFATHDGVQLRAYRQTSVLKG